MTYGIGGAVWVGQLRIRAEIERFDVSDADSVLLYSAGISSTFELDDWMSSAGLGIGDMPDLSGLLPAASLRQPPLLDQCPPQQELDLRVGAAQVVPRPAPDRVEHPGIGAQQERLAPAHV